MLSYILIGIAVVFVLLLCFCLAVANFAFDNYYQILQKMNQKPQAFKTIEYINQINEKFFDNRLKVQICKEYQDHYSAGVIALSEKTLYSNSLASLCIVSHELGHAQQDFFENNLKKLWNLKKIGKTTSFLFMPLFIVGLVLALLNVFNVLPNVVCLISGLTCVGLAFLIFIFEILIKFKEISIEKQASKFAVNFLSGAISENDLILCKEFLNSARMTYWAVLFRAMFGWTFLTKKEKLF